MTHEQTAYITAGQSLAIVLLKAWLRDTPREFWPTFAETDELTRKISHQADRLFYREGRKQPVTEEELEDVIVNSVPWLCWERFGPIRWNAYTLFSRSLEVQGLFMAKEGGCSAG